MDGRVVILSDLHLGKPGGAVRCSNQLRPLWKGADHLVLNGDTAEIHHTQLRTNAARQVVSLLDSCDHDGVRVTLLSGNHDAFISDTRHLLLAGGRVLVTHGDVLHPAIAPWSPKAQRIRQTFDEAIAKLDSETHGAMEHRLTAAQHAGFSEWMADDVPEPRHPLLALMMRPWAVATILHYWRQIPRLAAAFAAEHLPEAEFVVLGHTHRQGIWEVKGRTVINTGSYDFPGKPRAVVIEHDTLSVHRILPDGRDFKLEDRPLKRFAIPVTVRPAPAPTPAPAEPSDQPALMSRSA